MSAKIPSVREIEFAIVKMCGGWLKVLAVPNVYFSLLSYEADLIVLKSSGYATEYEIKRSFADFKNDFKKKDRAHKGEFIYGFAYVVPEKIADKVVVFLKEKYSEEDIPCVYSFDNALKMNKICGNIHPKTREARKMTDTEKFQLARLGTLRYWKLIGKELGENAPIGYTDDRGKKR